MKLIFNLFHIFPHQNLKKFPYVSILSAAGGDDHITTVTAATTNTANTTTVITTTVFNVPWLLDLSCNKLWTGWLEYYS
jgi:hypothetical protein